MGGLALCLQYAF
ncbi:Protein of unknown function [Bacillus wiedmannii]|nr:Protein of unknown function [Bacillus wiedmannii]